MGDRIYSYYDCPNCNVELGVEIYDAPSSMFYVEACHHCDYNVDIAYYKVEENHIVLLTPTEARARGVVPYCDREE